MHNVYRTQNLFSTSSNNQPRDEHFLVDTHEIFLHVHIALSDTSAYHVLLGDFNILHSSWGGAGVKADQSSQLLFSLQE
jgi:hypothetical protein